MGDVDTSQQVDDLPPGFEPEADAPQGFEPEADVPPGFEPEAVQEGKPLLKRMDETATGALPEAARAVLGPLSQVASGVTEGVMGLGNLPLELVRFAGKKLGVDEKYLPQSTEDLNKWMQAQGITADDPKGGGGRILRTTGQAIGASAVPAAGVMTAANLSVKGGALMAPAVEAATKAPGAYVASEAATAASAGVGAGVAKEMFPNTPAAELIGSLTGSVIPSAAAGTIRYLLRGGEATRQTMVKNIAEFERAGMSPTVGMATERRVNQAVEAGLSILPASSGRMAAYSAKAANALAKNVDDISAGLAPQTTRSPDIAGRAIIKGLTGDGGFIERFRARWLTLEAPVAKAIKADAPIATPNTEKALAELGNAINSAAYPQVGKVAQAISKTISNGQMAYGNMRTWRSSVGSLIPDAWAASLPEGKLKMLYAAMSQDVRAALASSGNPAALKAFERANKYYTASMARMDSTLAPVLRSDIPERVFLTLERSGKEGPTVLNAVKRSLNKEQWDAVVATAFNRMGTAPAGAQTAEGTAFSIETFLTNWSKLAKNPGSLRALMHGTSLGPKFVDDMTHVANIAERYRQAGKVFSNPSGTARAIANVGLGSSLISSTFEGMLRGNWVPFQIVAGVAGAANLSARAATNPAFVRFLAQSSQVPAAKMPGLIARLGVDMQKASPDVQVEMAGFLASLSDAFDAKSRMENQTKK